jgi:predicted nucleic acid binding AN1-type Zn finger protein
MILFKLEDNINHGSSEEILPTVCDNSSGMIEVRSLILLDRGYVWERGCDCVYKNFEFFFLLFLLKFNMICMF